MISTAFTLELAAGGKVIIYATRGDGPWDYYARTPVLGYLVEESALTPDDRAEIARKLAAIDKGMAGPRGVEQAVAARQLAGAMGAGGDA